MPSMRPVANVAAFGSVRRKNPMTIAEKTELALIPVLGTGVWLAGSSLPDRAGVGTLLLATSGLLLFQSLVRDLWLVARKRRADKSGSRRKERCMCVESTVGATGIIVGLVLLGSGIGRTVGMSPWTWSALALTVMVAGFLVKDLVFELWPVRIRRHKDHMGIIFTWKK